MAPIEFIERYGIADEVHELKGQTAQGNALGTMASACKRTLILTGTLLGGYADDLFNILYRIDPALMRREGFSHGEVGIRQFADAYGVLEKVTTIEASENACSKSKITRVVRRRPSASPLLFCKYLMNLAAFVSLEDISDALPLYREEVISVETDPVLEDAYSTLEEDIRQAIREHPGNTSVVSAAMNALLLYPDRPYGLGTVYGFQRNEETGQQEKFVIAPPPALDECFTYAKERRLLEEIKAELACGRKVQVSAVYTRKRDVTGRLKDLLVREGVHAEVLTAEVSPERREAWYERHFRNGMQVSIAHPKLVMTGLDILECPTILWYETGYSIYVLRQASTRSWRIGKKRPVRVAFLTYAATAQERCLRLMGKKLLVSLALEGKFQGEGLESMDVDDDLLTAMARELVTRQGVGEQAAEIWKALQVNHRIDAGQPVQKVASEGEMPQETALNRSGLQPPEAPAVQTHTVLTRLLGLSVTGRSYAETESRLSGRRSHCPVVPVRRTQKLLRHGRSDHAKVTPYPDRWRRIDLSLFRPQRPVAKPIRECRLDRPRKGNVHGSAGTSRDLKLKCTPWRSGFDSLR